MDACSWNQMQQSKSDYTQRPHVLVQQQQQPRIHEYNRLTSPMKKSQILFNLTRIKNVCLSNSKSGSKTAAQIKLFFSYRVNPFVCLKIHEALVSSHRTKNHTLEKSNKC